jgi:hypothetical protein
MLAQVICSFEYRERFRHSVATAFAASRCPCRCGEDPRKLLGFGQEWIHGNGAGDTCVLEALQPEDGFIRLLKDDSQLRGKFRLRSSAARGAIVRGN